MNNRKSVRILILFFNIFLASGIAGQSLGDPELKSLFSSPDTLRQNYSEPLKEATTEIQMTAATAFLLYKTVISSQDIPKCIFTPSCSEYAIEAIRKRGLFTGLLATFDRLTRCHGLVKPGHYPFDTQKNRFYDPPL
jgi:putative membrane protein insertion efficiency factor